MKWDTLLLGAVAPAVILALMPFVGAMPTTALIVAGGLIGFLSAWSNFYEVWKDPALVLEEDLWIDGVKRMGIGIVHMALQALTWSFYIPNYYYYMAYLALYYIGHWGAGVFASGAFLLAFALGLYMARRYE